MHDPFPLPRPQGLLPYVEQFAEQISLKTLPLHFHEVMFAFVLYHATYKYLAPVISRLCIPQIYSTFSARTKLNWDVHIVSFTQSTLICGLALWVMWADEERAAMTSAERVHGYTGGSGLIQAFAAGYFVWDLLITLQNMHAFGIGMLFHAISALCVFSLGFRPFVNYYAPTFILYELSSPFLNIHWFCDKLNMTGGKLQLYNGILLLLTFFSCRLMWGSYQSIRVFRDVWRSIMSEPAPVANPKFTVASAIPGLNDTMDFAGDQTVPLWISGAYLTSNLILNSLNWYWFSKMIATLRKRFDPPLGTRKPTIQEPVEIDEDEKVLIEGTHVETPVATPNVMSTGNDLDYVSAKLSKSGTHLEVESEEIRTRTNSGSRKKKSTA